MIQASSFSENLLAKTRKVVGLCSEEAISYHGQWRCLERSHWSFQAPPLWSFKPLTAKSIKDRDDKVIKFDLRPMHKA